MPVSSPDLKAFLRATPFFGGLSDASLDLLISMLVERRFDRRRHDRRGRRTGTLDVHRSRRSPRGEQATAIPGGSIWMSGLEPGDFFGEMTLIEMQNRSATVVAESATVLYELTARNLYTYYKADIHAYVTRDAEYQPRTLPAAPPRRRPHCRAELSRERRMKQGTCNFRLLAI